MTSLTPTNKPTSTTGSYYDPRYAQYGINMVPAKDLAFQRGSGNFNPSPNYDQTTYRGGAYSQAINLYAGSDEYQTSNAALNASNAVENTDYKTVMTNLDVYNKQPYTVGSTGFHPELKSDTWARSDFGYSRGSDQSQVFGAVSTQMAPSALMNFFFSQDNVNYLQNKIVSEVRRIRNVNISRQSDDELLIIMRNAYLYALSGWLPYQGQGNDKPPNGNGLGNFGGTDANGFGPKIYARGTILNKTYSDSDDFSANRAYSNSDDGCTSLEFQIKKLNQSVLETCIQQVLSGISMYQKYYADASSLPLPMSRPVLTTMKGDSVLQENLGFYSGHEMTDAMAAYNERFNIV